MNYSFINQKALDVFRKCRVSSFPIDCFSILKQHGYKLHTYEEIKQSNMLLYSLCIKYSNDAFHYKSTICYNQNIADTRIRFSLMHELGHHILRHAEETEPFELEADFFASNILAPRAVIEHEGLTAATEIKDYFNVSITAANRIIASYHKWQKCQAGISDWALLGSIYGTNSDKLDYFSLHGQKMFVCI